jgi:exopolysaccharide biosynthesis polyprenyl glycosylphosphotransferase
MKKKVYNLIIFFLYPAFDFMAVSLAILSSYKLYRVLRIGKQVQYAQPDIIAISLLIAFATVVIMLMLGAYKKISSVLNAEEIKNAVKGTSITFMLFAVVAVFVKWAPSRYVLFSSFIMSLLFIVAERTVLYHILPSFTWLKGLYKRVLIYGAGELGQALYRSITNSPKLGIIPVGFIDDNPETQGMVCYQSGFNTSNGVSVLGTGKSLKHLKEELRIDEVYVAISNIDHSTLVNILDYIKSENIKVSFVPNLYKIFVHKVKVEKIGQIPIVKEDDNFNHSYLRFKRYFDLLSAAVLFCLTWPLFAVIALAIKIDSKGPVFFRQKRVGKDGKAFQMYKFRSMFIDTDSYSTKPIFCHDPRITRIGRFLRKTSLDELPQLINVLKGDMSLVGPRPEMPFIVTEYNEIHKERLKVLPGITGLWQLSGDRRRPIHENMDYDLYYIRNISFFLDVAVLIETLIFAFKGI